MEEKECVNCGEIVTQNFCANCGQKKNVSALTWRSVLLEVSGKWFGTDNRFYRTFTHLWLAPSQVITTYLNGNRVRYIGPLAYVVIMTALYLLSFQFFGVDTTEFMEGMGDFGFDTSEQTQNQKEFQQKSMAVMSKNLRLIVVSLIPFTALSMTIFYKKRNYIESILTMSYISAQLIWLSMLSLAIKAFMGFGNLLIGFIFSTAYATWAVGSANRQKTNLSTWVRAFFTWVLGNLLFFIIGLLVGFIVVKLFYA